MLAVDTTYLIHLFRGHRPAVEHFQNLSPSTELFTTQVNVYELLRGLYALPSQQQSKLLSKTQELLSGLQILELNTAASKRAAQIWESQRRQGLEIGYGDDLIAGVLLANGCRRIVTNHAHFQHIEEMTVEAY